MKKIAVLAAFLIFVFGFAGAALAEEDNETSGNRAIGPDLEDAEVYPVLDDDNSSDSEENDSNIVVISPGLIRDRSLTVDKITREQTAGSLYCEKKGYSSETRTDTTGKEYSVCVFPDGKECGELEFLRGKCGSEYADVDEEDLAKSIVASTNAKLKERECEEGCLFRVGDNKVVVNELGERRRGISSEDVSAATELNLTVEEIDGKVMLRAYLSNGRWALVKYLPDKASDRAAEELGEKCEERNCTLELREIKVNNKEKLAYEIKTTREAKILGFIRAEMPMTAQVDAESGEVISVKKAWWGFLAR